MVSFKASTERTGRGFVACYDASGQITPGMRHIPRPTLDINNGHTSLEKGHRMEGTSDIWNARE